MLQAVVLGVGCTPQDTGCGWQVADVEAGGGRVLGGWMAACL